MTTVLPDRPADDRLDPAFLRLALVMMTGGLAVVFDTTIVSVALPDAGRRPARAVDDDPVGHHRLPAGARDRRPGHRLAVDRFGGKRVWLVALAVFLAGSLAVQPGLERRRA